jgi:hypothetical protein
MKALRRFLSRLFTSATRRRDEARLRDELEAHLLMQADENVRTGMSREEARRQAVVRFGPIEAIKDSYRDEQRLPMVDDFLQDVRYAFRLLGSFGFTSITGTLVFGVSTGDTATFASMAALLALISLLAFAIPVRAGTRLDAVAAIRHD